MAVTWAADTVPLAYENRELRSVELPATQFLVHDRIPYGLWLHSAPAGGYKSAFAAQLEHHIAYGTAIPGLDWQFAQHGDVLVISPDETAYEMQDRTFRIAAGGTLETDGLTGLGTMYPDIHVRHDPHGADLGQRIAWLWREIESIESMTGRHIVWVRWDTLGNFLGDKDGKDAYTHSQPLQKLNMLMATQHRVMFMPNHIGKDGRAIGSVNNVASANLSTRATITKNSNTGVISCLEEDTKMRGGRGWSAALVLRNGLLELTDESPQEAGHQLGLLPNRVAGFLAKNGPSTIAQLRAGTAISDKPLWNCILRLKAKQEIARREDGTWILQETGATAHWPADWKRCELCPCLVDPERGCVNVRCEGFNVNAWPLQMPDGQPEPVSVVIPSQRTPDDRAEAVAASVPAVATAEGVQPELEEAVPDIGGNEAVDKLRELVRESGLYAERKLAPEIRAKLAYENVCLGGAPNRYQFFPTEPPASSRVLILDRKAAYYQSCATWYTPNRLHREGNIDYTDVVHRSLAGMFEIIFTPFDGPYPDPLGGFELERGNRLLVPRATLDRVMDSVRAGFRQAPDIMYGLCGKGTERGPLFQWGRWCLQQRKEAAGRPQLRAIKEAQNQAFGTLRIADPDKRPGPVDRPDWQYAAIGHHYATINRYVWSALDAGEPCIASGNTDEIIFAMPENAGDDWLPASMRAHVEGGRFAVKAIRDSAAWYAEPRSLDG